MTTGAVCLLLLFILICASLSNAQNTKTELCRFNGSELLNREVFRETACKFCYQNAPNVTRVSPNISQEEPFEKEFWKNESHPYFLSFINASHAKRWASCCDNAADCCDKMLKTNEDADGCPMTWDKYGCWPKGFPNRKAKIECPDHFSIYYKEEKSPCKRYVNRMCQADKTWSDAIANCEPMEFQRFKPEYITPTSEFKGVCHRTDREVELTYEAYVQDTCARCYDYMPKNAFKLEKQLIYIREIGSLYNHRNETVIFADDELENWRKNGTSVVIDSLNLSYVVKWIQCCQAAKDCWHFMEDQNKQESNPDGYCPMTWDGWTCVKATPPGQTLRDFCPDHIFFLVNVNELDCRRKFKKECLLDGTWYQRKGREFTNYTPCSGNDEKRDWIVFGICLMAISMVGIIPALIIFNVYRSLRIPRIKLHVQLLLALFLYCFSATLFEGLHTLAQTQTKPPDIGGFCKLLSLLKKYFRMTTYVWMFCEGFYLHRQIANAFSQQTKFWGFYLAGWGFPILVTSVYAIARKVTHNDKCWNTPDPVDYILSGTSMFFLMMNLLFLCHIVYILVTKLRSVQSNEPRHFRKAVRATLILIPLFGAQTFFVVYKPDSKGGDCLPVEVYRYFASTFDGLQGFLVAIIYCYINKEVINLLKSDYYRYKAMRFNGRGRQRPSSGGGRWSMSTQVSAVHDNHSIHHENNNNVSSVSHLNVPLRQPFEKTNDNIPVTEL